MCFRIQKIPSELTAFEDDLDTLFGEISDLIGKDPLDNASLIPIEHELKYPKILEDISKRCATVLENQQKENLFNMSMDLSDSVQFSYGTHTSEKRYVPALRDGKDTMSETEEEELESLNSVW